MMTMSKRRAGDFLSLLIALTMVANSRAADPVSPADVGTQEGALLLICSAVTGSPTLAVALAAIRRSRDILWIVWGLAIGSRYSLKGRELLRAAAEAEATAEP